MSEAELVEGAGAFPQDVAEFEAVTGPPRSLWSDAWRELRANRLFVASATFILVFFIMALFPTLFTDADPRHCLLSRSALPPDSIAWFGYDLQGCDYLARTVHGARVSILIGLSVTTFAVLIALALGSAAGFYGGLVDTLVSRATDVMFAIPTLLGGIVILSVLESRGLKEVSLVLIVVGWPTMVRLMRSSVISTREADYIDAARTLGATDWRIITRHILPNSIAPVIVYATITIGVIISAEAALSFLGIGLQRPAISWGLMINTAQTRFHTSPHLLYFPGAFLSVTVFSFILMGDALRDALDPKLK